jgi:hypothetical protein
MMSRSPALFSFALLALSAYILGSKFGWQVGVSVGIITLVFYRHTR